MILYTIALVAVSASPPPEDYFSAVDRRTVLEASVRIWDGNSVSGSGTLIGRKTETYYVLMASHCLSEAGDHDHYAVELFDVADNERLTSRLFVGDCELVANRPKRDIAILAFEHSGPPLPTLRLSGPQDRANLSVGEPCLSAGCSGGANPPSLRFGVIHRTDFSMKGFNGVYTLTTAASQPGRSGGALISKNGLTVIGCAYGRATDDGVRYSVFTNLDEIQDVIDDDVRAPELYVDRTSSNLAQSDLMLLITKLVVLIALAGTAFQMRPVT